MEAHKQRSHRRGQILLNSAWLALGACAGGESADGDEDLGLATDSDTAGETQGDETGPTRDGSDPAADRIVPLDVGTLELDARCFGLELAPTGHSVAPEGHLWLRQDEQTWRVLDPLGHDSTQTLPAGVTALQAWGSEHAFAIDEHALLDVRDQWPQPLAWPQSLPAPTQLCGDPSVDANGFVIASGLLHRDRGAWWAWTDPSDAPWASPTWLAANAGSCFGPDGELWLSRENGEVWRITADHAARVEQLDGADAAVLLPGAGVAAILDGALVIGEADSLRRYRFEAGPVQSLSAGGEVLWVMAGGVLHRRVEGEFRQALHDGAPVQAAVLLADAGGVWALGPGAAPLAATACHMRSTPPILVEGVHDLQRLSEETVEIAVQISSGMSFSSAWLDGVSLPMEHDDIGHWRAAPQVIEEGWHTLEVRASGSRGATTRALRFEQRRIGELSFVGDIEPLFQEHCSGGACHGPDLGETTRPDLTTYEAWIEREAAILERVVTKGDMPPIGARKDSWGLDAQLMVSEWFETGAARENE